MSALDEPGVWVEPAGGWFFRYYWKGGDARGFAFTASRALRRAQRAQRRMLRRQAAIARAASSPPLPKDGTA